MSSGDIIPITTKAAYLAVRVELRDTEMMTAVCGICRYSVCDLCINCRSNPDAAASGCQLTRGECGHIYHSHCLSEWLNTNKTCPSCSKPWQATGPDFSP